MRTSLIKRATKETRIRLQLNLDGQGTARIKTGIGFFDHMLTLFSKHSLIDLAVVADGDLEVDYHHTVEDVGIVLGQALKDAVGDKRGINRYGWAYLPMDETLTRAVVDLSNRFYLEFRVPVARRRAGDFPLQLLEEFFRAVAVNAGMNLHLELLYGRDAHHIAESLFKGFAKALDMACRKDPRVRGLPSTKGRL
ncbi:MAG: imidazoleglycerol-phosphate dehydratase HisB [Verrucomicrobiales bacterium]|jgi:imidazoleglycerol-phosphate dehydratase|nr:imidazoleglycerol-phosphate dehydratase HisB [Verrucomicrobiales bacterium]